MNITIGRIVLYVLSHQDAENINRRRTNGGTIAERILTGEWPVGAQAHIGNPVKAWDILPALVVKVEEVGGPGLFQPPTKLLPTLKVFLDGTDSLWVLRCGEDEKKKPGSWHWPQR